MVRQSLSLVVGLLLKGIAEERHHRGDQNRGRAPDLALGVQWHAEFDAQSNPVNRALFMAFGAALRGQGRALS